jgi:hypothetical protein
LERLDLLARHRFILWVEVLIHFNILEFTFVYDVGALAL